MRVWNGTNCHAMTKTTTNRTRSEFPSQSWIRMGTWRPGPRPKFGSSSALKAMATAAEESRSGRKYRTARAARYFWPPAVKTPSSRLIGAWTMNEKNMILAVTSRALPVTGSVSTVVQLARPSSRISRRPSQLVKLRKTTPASGTTANTRKKTRAGAASHPDGPVSRTRRRLELVMVTPLLPDRGVHRGDELLRGDLLEEDLVKVGQHRVALCGTQRLVPGQREARRLLGQAVDEREEV